MKSLNPSPETSRRSGVIGLGLIPGHGSAVISLKVSHGHNQYEVAVPSNSNFGYLKSVISQSLGLNPETCKLYFGDIEKQDGESLQQAGLKENSEVLLVESVCGQPVSEEVQETPVASKGEEAVAEARKEINNLEQQVSALQTVIDSGKEVDDKEITYLTEMLMRQLLKLDGIDAEGEGRVQRKAEVRRVQNIVETLDALKSRNSNSSNHTQENVTTSTEWTAFDSSSSAAPAVVATSSSPTPSASLAPSGVPSTSPTPTPSSALPVMQPYPPSPMPSPSMYPESYPTPSNMASPNFATGPHLTPSTFPSHNYSGNPYAVPSPMQYSAPSTMPYATPYHYPHPHPHPYQHYDPSQLYGHSQLYYPSQYYDPSQMTYLPPLSAPSAAAPAPYHAQPNAPPSNPFSVPSSTRVTENWERFG
ncbi:mediator of RNA polymerase II transcription subunit 15-like isoform X1 [Salvia splendens]|uniref:mediator of RNA polymerase II transcription subunit 15-like isoform X1 n=1 Tax=Salvia splendens TaxID=180675 RepID=UPI001C27AB4F|nr:mediator of RNA polymerase II transcription subunit 15-like isoform X1 [Salvia splendens]